MTGSLFMPQDEPPKPTVVIEELPTTKQQQEVKKVEPPKPTKPIFVPKPCKIMNYKLIGENWVAGSF